MKLQIHVEFIMYDCSGLWYPNKLFVTVIFVGENLQLLLTYDTFRNATNEISIIGKSFGNGKLK